MTAIGTTADTIGLATLDEAGKALLFRAARTANSFSETPVTDAELDAIWELAKWPPTAANIQPLRVVFVRTAEGKVRLVPKMAEGNRAKTQLAPVTAILAADSQFHRHIPAIFPIRPELEAYFEGDAAMRGETGAFNAALQAGYFLLAVRANGLVAGPMAGFEKDAVDQEFFPDGRFHSILTVNIGHPGVDPWFERLPRLEHDAAISFA